MSLLIECQSSAEFWRHTCFLWECGVSLEEHDTPGRQCLAATGLGSQLLLPLPTHLSPVPPHTHTQTPPVYMFSFCYNLQLDLPALHHRIWDTKDLKIAGLHTDPHTSISSLSHPLAFSLQPGSWPMEVVLPHHCPKPGMETAGSVLYLYPRTSADVYISRPGALPPNQMSLLFQTLLLDALWSRQHKEKPWAKWRLGSVAWAVERERDAFARQEPERKLFLPFSTLSAVRLCCSFCLGLTLLPQI